MSQQILSADYSFRDWGDALNTSQEIMTDGSRHPPEFGQRGYVGRLLAYFEAGAAAGLSAAIGVSTETDTAQALTSRKLKAIGQVAETDTAQALTAQKALAIGQVSETDLAQALTSRKLRAIVQAAETNLAQPLARQKLRAIAQVTETDLAQALTIGGALGGPIGVATETDVALPLSSEFPVVRGRQASVDNDTGTTAKSITLPSGIQYGDLLIALIAAGTPVLTVPTGWTRLSGLSHTSSGPPDVTMDGFWRIADGSEGASLAVTLLTASRSAHIALRVEGASSPSSAVAAGFSTTPNSPNLIPSGGADQYLWISGAAIRTGTSPSLPANYGNFVEAVATTTPSLATADRLLDAASEDPGAWTYATSFNWVAVTVAVPPAMRVSIGPAIETDVAQALTRGGALSAPIGVATETDAGQALTARKLQEINQAVEVDVAQSFAQQLVGVVGQAVETDLAQALAARKVLAIGVAVETDVAMSLLIPAPAVGEVTREWRRRQLWHRTRS